MKHFFKVKKDFDSLTACLTEAFAHLSLSTIKKQMRLGEVRLNGEKTTKDMRVQAGDEVKIFLPKANDFTQKPLEIVYEDDFIIAVNKPILCEVEVHLEGMVTKIYPNAKPVHRLDRNTRGIVLFSKTKNANIELLKLFKEKRIIKYYRAHVAGIPKSKKCAAKVYLKKLADKSLVLVSNTPKQGYIEALLDYEVIKELSDNTSVLDIKLITGRTHQIRATLAHLGYPIIGDGKYGNEQVNRTFSAQYQKLLAYRVIFDFKKGEVNALKHLANTEINLKSLDFCQNS